MANKNTIKYLPSLVSQSNFELLLQQLKQEDVDLLKMYYDLDENFLTPFYVTNSLQFNDKNELAKKINSILAKDHMELYFECLVGNKITYKTFNDSNISYKFILFQKVAENSSIQSLNFNQELSLDESFKNFETHIFKIIKSVYNSVESIKDSIHQSIETKLIIDHLKYAKIKSESFVGRHALIKTVLNFINQENLQFFVITGMSGSGKTT